MKASLLLLLFVWRARAKRGIMVPGVPSGDRGNWV